MRFLFIAFAIISAAFTLPSHASDNSLPLKIGLHRYFSHAANLLVSADTPFTIKDTTGQIVAHGNAGTLFKIEVSDNGLRLVQTDSNPETDLGNFEYSIVITSDSGDAVKVANFDNIPDNVKWYRYRGAITARADSESAVSVIDTIDLESYLYGVLAGEIGADAPGEALKAQAIAARTYALKNRGKLQAEDGVNLDDTTRCQSYLGVDGEAPQVTAAVDATRGQVLTYQGALIDAPYSTDCGGMTACDPECPYLQAVPDRPGPDLPDYTAGSRWHTWTFSYTKSEVKSLFTKDVHIGAIKFADLRLGTPDASGRIKTATIIDTDGVSHLITGARLRQILGVDHLRSTFVTLKRAENGDYVFTGHGWGHGLGMSQLGAIAMASAPYNKSFQEILFHYYVGVELADVAAIR